MEKKSRQPATAPNRLGLEFEILEGESGNKENGGGWVLTFKLGRGGESKTK